MNAGYVIGGFSLLMLLVGFIFFLIGRNCDK